MQHFVGVKRDRGKIHSSSTTNASNSPFYVLDHINETAFEPLKWFETPEVGFLIYVQKLRNEIVMCSNWITDPVFDWLFCVEKSEGFSVWKAGNTWRRSSLESEPSKAVSNVDDSAESTWRRSSLDNNVDNSDDTRPGRSFRKFRFDMDPILKAMDDAFSSSWVWQWLQF